MITHNLRIKGMIKETLLLENTVKKENCGFKNMPFPPKSTKKKDDEEFERFAEMIRPVFFAYSLD